jgi:DNA-binding transcriptional ArsR family regulator
MSDTLTVRLKALTDLGRLRILALNSVFGELCVCEIAEILNLSVSKASRDLRDLEAAGWLASRREGRWMHYRLASLDAAWAAAGERIIAIFAQTPQGGEDLKRCRMLLAKGRRAKCSTTLTTLETYYEQLDHSAK